MKAPSSRLTVSLVHLLPWHFCGRLQTSVKAGQGKNNRPLPCLKRGNIQIYSEKKNTATSPGHSHTSTPSKPKVFAPHPLQWPPHFSLTHHHPVTHHHLHDFADPDCLQITSSTQDEVHLLTPPLGVTLCSHSHFHPVCKANHLSLLPDTTPAHSFSITTVVCTTLTPGNNLHPVISLPYLLFWLTSYVWGIATTSTDHTLSFSPDSPHHRLQHIPNKLLFQDNPKSMYLPFLRAGTMIKYWLTHCAVTTSRPRASPSQYNYPLPLFSFSGWPTPVNIASMLHHN